MIDGDDRERERESDTKTKPSQWPLACSLSPGGVFHSLSDWSMARMLRLEPSWLKASEEPRRPTPPSREESGLKERQRKTKVQRAMRDLSSIPRLPGGGAGYSGFTYKEQPLGKFLKREGGSNDRFGTNPAQNLASLGSFRGKRQSSPLGFL